jgi:hypothetical protein
MIRYHWIFTALLAFLLACSSGDKSEEEEGATYVKNPQSLEGVDSASAAEITFKNKTYDFGTVKQGTKVEHYYVFENTGQNDLVISNTSAGCGCTVPSKPDEPIPPGGKDSIQAVFDSEGRTGQQHKTITIHANTIPKKTELTLKGSVEKPES